MGALDRGLHSDIPFAIILTFLRLVTWYAVSRLSMPIRANVLSKCTSVMSAIPAYGIEAVGAEGIIMEAAAGRI
jgi:hypothetical protein